MQFLLFLLMYAFQVHSVDRKQSEDFYMTRILERASLLKVDISADSKLKFQQFMQTYCIAQMSPAQFLIDYIKWEKVEFFKGVRDFLNPIADTDLPEEYYRNNIHEFRSNCSLKNMTRTRISHQQLKDDHKFEDYILDFSFTGVVDSIGL